MFHGCGEVYKPLLYDSHRAIRFTMTCLYLAINLESFFYYNGISTAEGTGFWTPRPKGPSSGVVASILLVSPGFDCPETCLAEVCATCLEKFQFILVKTKSCFVCLKMCKYLVRSCSN